MVLFRDYGPQLNASGTAMNVIAVMISCVAYCTLLRCCSPCRSWDRWSRAKHEAKAEHQAKLTIAAIFWRHGPLVCWRRFRAMTLAGIATYSSAGASYGYKMLWMLPRHDRAAYRDAGDRGARGCVVTGKGPASLIRERFGVRKSVLAMAALLIANTAVTISEFAGIASGLALFWRPGEHLGAAWALLVWMLTMSGSFQRIEKILLLVSCVFVTYIVAAFMAGPN